MSQSIILRSAWHVDIYYIALDIPIFSCRRRDIHGRVPTNNGPHQQDITY